jgi:hypothetical protein
MRMRLAAVEAARDTPKYEGAAELNDSVVHV